LYQASMSLKRKYAELLRESADVLVETHQLKRQRALWSRERAMLVDRIVDLEWSSKRDHREKRRDDPKHREEDDEPETEKPSPRTPAAAVPPPPAMAVVSQPPLDPNLCKAIVGGRQCKFRGPGPNTYCNRHLALDPNSGYVFCVFQGQNGKQCQNSVKKDASSPYCTSHQKWLLDAKKAAEDAAAGQPQAIGEQHTVGEAITAMHDDGIGPPVVMDILA